MTLNTPSTSNTADVPVRAVDTAATFRSGSRCWSARRRDTDPYRRRRAHRWLRQHTWWRRDRGGALPDAPQVAVEIRPTGGTDGRPVAGPTVRPAGLTRRDRARSGIRAKAIPCSPMPTTVQASPATTILAAEIDSSYGQPRADHGRLGDQYLPPRLDDVPHDIRD